MTNLAQVMRPFWQLISSYTFMNSSTSNAALARAYLQQLILPMFDLINKGQSNWTTPVSIMDQPQPITAQQLSGSGVGRR